MCDVQFVGMFCPQVAKRRNVSVIMKWMDRLQKYSCYVFLLKKTPSQVNIMFFFCFTAVWTLTQEYSLCYSGRRCFRSYWAQKRVVSLCLSCVLLSVLQDDSTGEMIFDEVFHALSRCLAGLAQPFQVPGTDQFFKPKIFVTILAYSSIIGLTSHQVVTATYTPSCFC